MYEMLTAGQLEHSMKQSSAITVDWNVNADTYQVRKPARDKIKIMIVMPWLIIGGAERFFWTCWRNCQETNITSPS